MKATSGTLPTGHGWAYEIKWDGMRVLADIAEGAADAQQLHGGRVGGQHVAVGVAEHDALR